MLGHTGTTANVLLYAGEFFDPVTGLINLRARYYDPSLGRFLSVDPAKPVLTDPQSLNSYIYTRDNPVGRTDPGGQQDLVELATTIAIIGILTSVGSFGAIAGGVLFYRSPSDFLRAPDAGLLGLSGSFSPTAAILTTPFGETPLGLGIAAATFLVNGVGGLDTIFPKTLDRGWFYTYFGVSFGYSGPPTSPFSFSGVYAGLVWNVTKPSDYKGPFLAVGGSYGRYGGVVPAGATVFTGFGRNESYGFSVPVSPGSSFSIVASLTDYFYLGEITTQDIISAITLQAVQDYLSRLEYGLIQGAIEQSQEGF